jgi:hypothetical protein
MLAVIVRLIFNAQEYQDKTNHPDCQSENVDKSECFLPANQADHYFEITADHKKEFAGERQCRCQT